MWMQRHSGNTSVGLLTKQDSIEIEQLTGRKIIGEIDTTEFFHYGESMWHYLKQEKDFVKRNVDLAFDYNLSEYYSVIHFFYDEVSWGKNKPFFLNKEIKTTFFFVFIAKNTLCIRTIRFFIVNLPQK